MKVLCVLALTAVLSQNDGCRDTSQPPQSASGVTKADVVVPTGPDGLTAEQRNIRDRLVEDNKPGAIKHLYVISAFSGQVLLYSTVRGKVTSGGKRLTPTTVTGPGGNAGEHDDYVPVQIGTNGGAYRTAEVLQDDGTYGTSGDYLFWWDTRGVYHQHYVQGGQIVHISSEPLNVPHIVLNLNETKGASP